MRDSLEAMRCSYPTPSARILSNSFSFPPHTLLIADSGLDLSRRWILCDTASDAIGAVQSMPPTPRFESGAIS